MHTDWKTIKYFEPYEFNDAYHLNNGADISTDVVKELDFLRDWVGYPIIVTAGYDSSGHSDDSYHYKGLAVDIIILAPFGLREQWKYVRGTKFQGIGIYPDWSYQGVKRGGFHLDWRIDAQIWRPDGKGGYIYWLT